MVFKDQSTGHGLQTTEEDDNDDLSSLATLTQTVAQIAERFEPNAVLWAFHMILPSSYELYVVIEFLHKFLINPSFVWHKSRERFSCITWYSAE